ncbi:hypothetical protein [Deinococcus misasensis]|uniref:hypothetical protein n=1 Tax=Deinococcus misasensis TaxID=392413 RepID=UPI0005543376|nr:hypothetical protein [Deinococcus misasensis]
MTATEVKAHPLLFRTEMVQAILSGQKTETRRVVKMPPAVHADKNLAVTEDGRELYYPDYPDEGVIGVQQRNWQPGDCIWGKETYADLADQRSENGVIGAHQHQWIYRADGCELYGETDDPEAVWLQDIKWKSSRFMPRAASRLLLQINSIRIERLHGICQGGSINEGMLSLSKKLIFELFPDYAEAYREAEKARQQYIALHGDWLPGKPPFPIMPLGPSPLERFEKYWDSINPKAPWASNPWVTVIVFKKVMP